MIEYTKYVGLDSHKDSISVAVAHADGQTRFYGTVDNSEVSISKLLKQLSPEGEVINFCYEAGPCGYGLYRQITASGHNCDVVAPSLIPKRAGDRVKTDRRDALNLAKLHRAGELSPVWVPAESEEALRDLTRARLDFKQREKQIRQQLSSFLLRNSRVYRGKTRWSKGHWQWMREQKFSHPLQQIVFQEYLDEIEHSQACLVKLENEMQRALESSPMKPVVEGLMALRGVDFITALSVIAELGDITRFATAGQLMAYLGLTPSEYSSGGKRRQGGISKTGNGIARRYLVESAWSYRFPARKTLHIQRRAKHAPQRIQAIAWEAQKRLCGRYRHLNARGKTPQQTCVAVARELAGFIWAIACEMKMDRKSDHARG